MSPTKDEARGAVEALVARFQGLKAPDVRAYNEENTKKDFILPLFRALGWHVDNAEEVAAEEKASNGRVDYAFKLRDVSRFFLEAKPLDANLLDAKVVNRVVEYALNRGVTWAVLTSFKSLHLFYALGRGSPESLRWKTLGCTDFIPHFDDLWLLSRESFEVGAITDVAHRDGKLPPAHPIERRLFDQFLEWREALTNDLLLHHNGQAGKLTDAQVDEVVERLFNRLIFIRNAEDRQIEDRLLWQAWQDWKNGRARSTLAAALRRIFRQFRDWYDSDLFPDQPHLLDEETLVYLDENLLDRIIGGLYVIPNTYADYDFSLIDADVLGAVYEQYLGHVAQVAKERAHRHVRQLPLGATGTQMEVVEKRAKRKQQGIYYTPKWVVDYLVKQTVGRALDEAGSAKGAAEDRLYNLRVLDPACGSGSFLIRAYDELLHRAAALSGRPKEHVFADERGEMLRNNIFGVDLDPQAVDIARLNLMLRGLIKRERLPTLAENVQVGNSLISGREQELRPYFGDSWEAKRAFNWETRFAKVMAEGGFDVIVGNPPYVRIQTLPREDVGYFKDRYQSAQGSFDLYVMFIELGLRLLKPGGRLGFITSGKFLKAAYGAKLRHLIATRATVESVVDLSLQQVFEEATTYPVMLVLRKGRDPRVALRYSIVKQPVESSSDIEFGVGHITHASQAAITGRVWPLPERPGTRLLAKCQNQSLPLGDLWEHMFQGPVTGRDGIFVLHQKGKDLFSGGTRRIDIEQELTLPLLKGSIHIRRYYVENSELRLLFPYARTSDPQLLTEQVLATSFPKCWAYLKARGSTLEAREEGRFREHGWYGFSRPQNLAKVMCPKLLCPAMVRESTFAYDSLGGFALVGSGGGGGGGYGITLGDRLEPHFALGILNSRLANHILKQISTPFRGGYFGCDQQTLRRFPMRRVDPANRTDRQQRDRIHNLVRQLLPLKERIVAKGTAHDNEREDMEREAAQIDREIDEVVYELYGLTKAEIALVEDAE